MEDEIEAIRKKKLQELEKAAFEQRQMEEQMYQEQKEEMEAQKKIILRQILTQEARERLGNLRLTKPELVNAVEHQLILMANRLERPIDDKTLKIILQKMMPKKREPNIKWR